MFWLVGLLGAMLLVDRIGDPLFVEGSRRQRTNGYLKAFGEHLYRPPLSMLKSFSNMNIPEILALLLRREFLREQRPLGKNRFRIGDTASDSEIETEVAGD